MVIILLFLLFIIVAIIHYHFIDDKLAVFVERHVDQEILTNYLKSEPNQQQQESGQPPSLENSNLAFVLQAPSGAGKTALMAWSARYDCTHFTHVVTCKSSSFYLKPRRHM